MFFGIAASVKIMKFSQCVYLFVCSLLVMFQLAVAENLSEFPRAKNVVEILVKEHGFERTLVEKWMKLGRYRQTPIKNLAAPAEQTKEYSAYKPMFVSSETINNGRKFYEKNKSLLLEAENQYGVPASIIVSIIGIESRYGRSRGRHRTFDSLGSLAVTEGRRADYFQREWIKFLVISKQQGFDPMTVQGSYAGATGFPQFMPTSYEAYAVDHDNDGDIDIWNDSFDAIGSVANYLKENGWRKGEWIVSIAEVTGNSKVKVNSFDRNRTQLDLENKGWVSTLKQTDDSTVFPIRLDGADGVEYWLGFKNFWVISRYNRSIAYSMAVFQLAEAIQLGL